MKSKGFTLIEILIVVLILGILAAIAIVNYQDYVARQHRTAVILHLRDLAGHLTSYRQQHGAFPTQQQMEATSAMTALLTYPLNGDVMYRLTIVNTANGGYRLSATPTSPGAMANDVCGALTLTNLGVRGFATGATVDKCWGNL